MLHVLRKQEPLAAILRIRCKRSTFRQFKKLAVDFTNYEETLIKLMAEYERFGKLEGRYKAD